MKNHLLPFALLGALLSPVLFAQETLRTFRLSPTDSISVTTELVVRAPGATTYRYTPIDGAMPTNATAFDVMRAHSLPTKSAQGVVVVTLPEALAPKAEFRLRVEESLPSTGLSFHTQLTRGRYLFVLPTGYGFASISQPAQIETANGHLSAGVVITSENPVSVTVTMEQAPSRPDLPFAGNFLALDTRSISYQLLDPAQHAISLWLEIFVDHPGQSHFYSQLRIADHVTPTATLDMDRGIELPARILSGKEANALGDAPAPFPDDAQVLTADLGYKIPPGGSARIRSFQTVTDAPNYRLTSPDEFRLDRFIARTRTQYNLPAGWTIASMDQPGVISKTADGRITVDFATGGSAGSSLVLIGRRVHPAN